MSHAQGQVIDLNGDLLGWFEYDGTNDVALSRIYENDDELSDNWRKSDETTCTCGQEPTEVYLWSSYGSGFHWPAKVCTTCKAIVSNRRPYEEFEPGTGWPKSGFLD